MAGVNYSAVSAWLNLMYAPGLTEQFRRDAVLPNLIPTVFEANSTCTWRVKLAGRNTAGARAEGYAVQSSDMSTDTRLQASLAWAHYEAYASITGTAQRIAAANTGYSQAIGGGGELDREIADAGEELAVKMSEDSYGGSVADTPAEIEGLARAVDSSGTYAGINSGTYTTWVSGEATLATTDLSVPAIRANLFRAVKDATGRKPSVVLCSGTVMDSVKALADSQAAVTVIQTPGMGAVNIANLGFDGVMVDGVPFIEDRHATASTMYALDLAYLEYAQIPPDWISMDPGQIRQMVIDVTGKSVPLGEIEAAVMAARNGRKMVAQINALAKTGDSTQVQVVLDAQLRLRRRNAASKLTLT